MDHTRPPNVPARILSKDVGPVHLHPGDAQLLTTHIPSLLYLLHLSFPDDIAIFIKNVDTTRNTL